MTDAKTLPHPSDLQAGQALLVVDSYELDSDSFFCTLHDASPSEGVRFDLPALVLPMLVHEYGEPDEFIGRMFLIERGASKADYARAHGVLHTVAEDFDDSRFGGEPMRNAALVAKTMNELPQPHQL